MCGLLRFRGQVFGGLGNLGSFKRFILPVLWWSLRPVSLFVAQGLVFGLDDMFRYICHCVPLLPPVHSCPGHKNRDGKDTLEAIGRSLSGPLGGRLFGGTMGKEAIGFVSIARFGKRQARGPEEDFPGRKTPSVQPLTLTSVMSSDWGKSPAWLATAFRTKSKGSPGWVRHSKSLASPNSSPWAFIASVIPSV